MCVMSPYLLGLTRHGWTLPSLKILFAVCLLVPESVWAWGANGHRCIAHVAESHLRPSALQEVRQLLDGASMAKVSTWADEIRSDPDWNYVAPWHYVNIDDDERYAPAVKSPGGDVIEAIRRFSDVLKDRKQPKAKRADALRFLIHFVGDIHQPLHVGRRRDLGGNKVEVTWFGKPSNLHSVWDNGIIRHWDLSYMELAAFLDVPSEQERRRWQEDGVVTWAEENLAVRKDIYRLGNRKLGYAYAYRHSPLVRRRLLQAGVRLAGLLNTLLAR